MIYSNFMRHTFAVWRHYPHKNNVPTEEWIELVKRNAAAIDHELPENIVNPHIIWTNQARTVGTGKLIAETLDVKVGEAEIKDYLNIVPSNWPMKDVLKKFSELYDVHPDIIAGLGVANDLVYKIQRNQIEGLDTKPFARFTTNKLYNAIQAIKRNPKVSNLTLGWFHGGFWLETVLYALRGDNLPKAWEWQIKMAEMIVMHVDIDEQTKEATLTIKYRWEEHSIGEKEIKEKIDALKS